LEKGGIPKPKRPRGKFPKRLKKGKRAGWGSFGGGKTGGGRLGEKKRISQQQPNKRGKRIREGRGKSGGRKVKSLKKGKEEPPRGTRQGGGRGKSPQRQKGKSEKKTTPSRRQKGGQRGRRKASTKRTGHYVGTKA